MKTIHRPSRAVAIAAGSRHVPGPWRDLKRDWQRWTPAERFTTECLMGVAIVVWGLTLAAAWLH